MKKTLLLIGIFIVALLLAFPAVIVLGNPDFMEELPQRLALHHITGDIHVTVDGEEMDLSGTELSFDGYESATIKNNTFQFRNGAYGYNTFRFIIPVSGFGDVCVEFGHFNTNWWHQVHYTLNIDIVTNDDNTLTANTTQKIVFGGKEHFAPNQQTDILTKENAKVNIYVGA